MHASNVLSLVILALIPSMAAPFVVFPGSPFALDGVPTNGIVGATKTPSSTKLLAIYNAGRSSSRRNKDERSKRQYRVGELVRTELAQILHSGLIKGDATYLEQELRQRISVVRVDVSPDLRQARVTVSIRNGLKRLDGETETGYYEDDPVVEKRRAFSWLVDNTKPLRHTLAQRMSHMKTSPDLSFNQVDVAAATDVMYLIDKLSQGYERESLPDWELRGEFNEDEDEFDDDDDWDEVDDDFFDMD